MEQSAIEHGNVLPPRGKRGSLTEGLLMRLPSLKPNDNIFYPEPSKDRRLRLYNSLYKASKRYNLSIAVRFYKDGLRVWKVTK